MPIVVNLDVMLARRKLQLNTVAERIGITPQNLSVLNAGRARAIASERWRSCAKYWIASPGICWRMRAKHARDERRPRASDLVQAERAAGIGEPGAAPAGQRALRRPQPSDDYKPRGSIVHLITGSIFATTCARRAADHRRA